MADVWLSSFSTTPVVTLTVFEGQDTFRGGGDFIAFSVNDVLNTSRDATFQGTTLPAGWTDISTGAGSAGPSTAGILLDTGVTPGSRAGIETPDSDYTNFDAAVDVDQLLPVDNGAGIVDIAMMELVIAGGITARVGFRRGDPSDSTAVRAYGEIVSGATIIESGSRSVADPNARLTLRLVRNNTRVYGLFGVRDARNRLYSEETKVFEGLLGTFLGGSLRLTAKNNAANRTVRSRMTNFTIESHATINGRLLDKKFIVSRKQIRGFVPRATLAEIGEATVDVFGLFGADSVPAGFTYVLPPPKTVGNEVTRTLRTFNDPTVRDT